MQNICFIIFEKNKGAIGIIRSKSADTEMCHFIRNAGKLTVICLEKNPKYILFNFFYPGLYYLKDIDKFELEIKAE